MVAVLKTLFICNFNAILIHLNALITLFICNFNAILIHLNALINYLNITSMLFNCYFKTIQKLSAHYFN
uniref:NADH dehydrogenase subunit 4L n=1 Tax=Romanomermis culicivorax TaxID=13658 RepID=A0A915IE47_ROMCU